MVDWCFPEDEKRETEKNIGLFVSDDRKKIFDSKRTKKECLCSWSMTCPIELKRLLMLTEILV